ncbi:transporter substrate-binding domain-containing protein [Mycoplana dimorpha]|uniref:Amino acid ABC transporter substrate-binding protein (PAAT family) n=1 Tax=Mycoplana dimorpha TaxID=28320 RepID=A0A2T5B394_MYCDI|nr:transporter substrate-binding domain-containing protein [Mycoplana dimorpha]PTM93456.1 amino acid ABC transporter substrate-binding protein (PAAT family) [Mycoplana dimorpha]
MQKSFLVKAVVGAAMLLAATAGAYAQDALDRVKQAGTLKVGTETAFAPFDFIDAGEHAGLNVDLYDEIGKELGVKIEWVLLPWEGVLPGLEAGKFDIVGGPATVTKQRMERYRFTPPVAEATVALLKRAGDESVQKPEDVAGKVVGGGKASAQLEQLKAFVDKLPGKADVREYPGNNEAYADLAAGRIVAVGNSLPNIAFVAKQRPETFEVVQPPFGTKAYFAYPGLKDDDHKSLMDAIEAAMLKIKGDGRLAKIQEKWFGATFDTPDLVTEPAL